MKFILQRDGLSWGGRGALWEALAAVTQGCACLGAETEEPRPWHAVLLAAEPRREVSTDPSLHPTGTSSLMPPVD